jgi:hypothetical protein
MRIIDRFPCLVAVCLLQAYAQYPDAGTSAFSFLKLDNNARTVAMGGASIGMANGIYGASINPAAAGFLTHTQAMIGYQSLILDAWTGPLGYAMPYKNCGVFSSNIMYASHGYLDSSEALDENGNGTGASWHIFSLVGSLAWSKVVYDNLSVGIACKGIYHPIKSSQQYYSAATAIAFDAGFQYRMLNSRVIVGGVLQNAGFLVSNYTKDSPAYPLPLGVAVGISYMPQYIPSLRMALDLQKDNDDFLNYKPGFEWAIYKKSLFLRGGYGFSEPDLEEVIKQMKNQSSGSYVKSNSSGLSLGLGLVTEVSGVATNVDVAYLHRVEDLTPSFMLSILVEY